MVIGARGIPDVEGGAEKNAEKLFPLMAQRGYCIEVVGIDRFIAQDSFRGVSLTGLSTLRFLNSDKIVYNLLAAIRAAVKRPDLVHLQGTNSALFLWFYKLCGLPVVLRYGSSDSQFRKWGSIGRATIRFCEMQIKFADHVVAVSEHLKRELTGRLKVQEVTVIPNGIENVEVSEDAETFWSGLELRDGRYVLSVGRLTVDKDFETLVRAVKSMRNKDIKLVVAGGPDEKGYSERLLELADDRIKFIGCIDRPLLAALYSHCGVYAHCSRHEGLSNAVLEAISHQRPLVVSDIEAHTAMPLPTCSYFNAGDANDLVGKLEQAFECPQSFVTDIDAFLDWPHVADCFDKIYQRVIDITGFAKLERTVH